MPISELIRVLSLSVLALLPGFSAAAEPPGKGALSPLVEVDRPLVLKGDPRPVYAIVRLEAARDERAERDRPPLNVALVLDRSGSMADAGKLDYLKRAANLAVGQLGQRDVLSIVEYDDQITVMWPHATVDSPSVIRRLIDDLTPRGSTNLAGGMMAGVDEARAAMARGERGVLTRVLLLSDGLANTGETRPEAIRSLVRQAKADGVPISALGLGRDFDEDLMQAIAENGGGRYYYIENPDQMSRIFAEELRTLVHTAVRDCHVRFDPAPGVSGAEILGFEGPNAAVGDLYGGERRALLLRVPLDAQSTGPKNLGSLNVSYMDAEAGTVHNFAVNLGVQVSEDEGAVRRAENHDIAVEATLAETERGQREAVKLLESGDHAGAERQMSQLVKAVEVRQATLKDKRLEKKLEALSVERRDMAEASLAPEVGSEYLKRSKQRLYQAKQGQRSLSLLQEGDQGIEVEQLQEALTKAGYYKGPIDGVFSASVTQAVKAFQQAQNIGPDGIAGPATMKELGLY